jgi:3-ketosteroid 9alpha-monooxygenase subunit A
MNIDVFEVTVDGHRATQRTVGKGRDLRGKEIDVESIATYHGPAIQFTHLGWAYDMVLINAHTPIDDNELILRFGVALRPGVGVELPPQILQANIAAARDGYFQDVRIWEHKRWRERPILADGDGPIAKIRSWHRSFFAAP